MTSALLIGNPSGLIGESPVLIKLRDRKAIVNFIGTGDSFISTLGAPISEEQKSKRRGRLSFSGGARKR